MSNPATLKTKHTPISSLCSAWAPLINEGIKSRKPEAFIDSHSSLALLPRAPAYLYRRWGANLSLAAAPDCAERLASLVEPVSPSRPLAASQRNQSRTASPQRQLSRQATPFLLVAF